MFHEERRKAVAGSIWHDMVKYGTQPLLTKPDHMRHMLLAATALGFFMGTGAASAQLSGSTAGFKGGLNYSNLLNEGAEVDDKNARLGFHAGVFGRVAPSDAIGVQAELLYTTKGTTVTWDGLIDQEFHLNLAYVEVPLFVVLRLGEAIELHAGGYGGYLLNSNVKTDGDLGDASDDLDRDNFNGLDYGVLGGLGFNLGAAQIGARYNYGLAKIASSDGAEFLLGDARNSVAQLYLAIGLGAE